MVRGLTSIYEWYSIQFASEERLKMIIILIAIKELPICMEYNTACNLFTWNVVAMKLLRETFINLPPKRHLLVRRCGWSLLFMKMGGNGVMERNDLSHAVKHFFVSARAIYIETLLKQKTGGNGLVFLLGTVRYIRAT